MAKTVLGAGVSRGAGCIYRSPKQAEFETFKVAAIDTDSGPRLRVCLWNFPAGACLLIKVCHYVADAAGTRDVARLISGIYAQLGHKPDYQPEPNLTGSPGLGKSCKPFPGVSIPAFFSNAYMTAGLVRPLPMPLLCEWFTGIDWHYRPEARSVEPRGPQTTRCYIRVKRVANFPK